MTGADRPSRIDGGAETAQIVLVGAVTMAFIIVGLVLVANTVLYTESVGAERSLGSADKTAQFQTVARDETANVVYRVNTRENFSSRSALDAAIRDNVTTLSHLLATEYGQREGVFVNVSANLTESDYGARIEQDDEATFNGSGSGNWTPVTSSDATAVAEFQATFNVSEMPGVTGLGGLPFELTINGDTDSVVYAVNESGNLTLVESNTALSIGSVVSAADPACREINTSERVYVDFSAGRVPGTDCTFNGTNDLEGPFSLSIRNGDTAVGTYSFVVRDDDIATQAKYANFDGTDSDDPYSSFVYWSVETTTQFEGPELSYNITRTLQIYGPGSNVSDPFWLTDDGSIFFSDGDGVSVIPGNESGIIDLSASISADAIGPAETDITGDGSVDIPYVTDGDEIGVTNASNDTTTLADSDEIPGTIEGAKTRIGVGQWEGSETSIFFVNENHDTIYRVNASGSVFEVAGPPRLPDSAQAVVGMGDVNGDGVDELVFADGSQTLRYLAQYSGTNSQPMEDSGTGSSASIGSGSLADFDDDGTEVVVAVGGSNNIKIIGESTVEGGEGTRTINLPGNGAAKSPVTIADVDGDGKDEIIYVGATNGKLKYVDDVGGTPTVKFILDEDGNKVDADDGVGVA